MEYPPINLDEYSQLFENWKSEEAKYFRFCHEEKSNYVAILGGAIVYLSPRFKYNLTKYQSSLTASSRSQMKEKPSLETNIYDFSNINQVIPKFSPNDHIGTKHLLFFFAILSQETLNLSKYLEEAEPTEAVTAEDMRILLYLFNYYLSKLANIAYLQYIKLEIKNYHQSNVDIFEFPPNSAVLQLFNSFVIGELLSLNPAPKLLPFLRRLILHHPHSLYIFAQEAGISNQAILCLKPQNVPHSDEEAIKMKFIQIYDYWINGKVDDLRRIQEKQLHLDLKLIKGPNGEEIITVADVFAQLVANNKVPKGRVLGDCEKDAKKLYFYEIGEYPATAVIKGDENSRGVLSPVYHRRDYDIIERAILLSVDYEDWVEEGDEDYDSDNQGEEDEEDDDDNEQDDEEDEDEDEAQVNIIMEQDDE